MGWNSSGMMIAWSGSPVRCRCGCWLSGPACGPGCHRRWRAPGFDPVYDRGQVLIDMAVAQVLGAEAISDFQGLRHLRPVTGPVPSNPTMWRALAEVEGVQLRRVNAAVTTFRRHWWGLLADRPQGFPWLTVAGRELSGSRWSTWTPRSCSPRWTRRTPSPPTRAGSGSVRTLSLIHI